MIVEIPKNSQFVFKVIFKPLDTALYYFQLLQCFINRKTGNENKLKKLDLEDPTNINIDFNTLNKSSMSIIKYNKTIKAADKFDELEPPIILSIPVVGNSFPPGSQPFLPMLSISQNGNVVFEPCSVGQTNYQSVQFTNNSDTPVYFRILGDPTNTFRVYPKLGLVPGKSTQLVCLEFNPKDAREYNYQMQCILNHSSSYIKKIHLYGISYTPDVVLGDNSMIYFPPSYMGVPSSRNLNVRNISLIPVNATFQIPKKYSKEISFDPQIVKLGPNECSTTNCTLIPSKAKAYNISIVIKAEETYNQNLDLIGYFNPGSGNIEKENVNYRSVIKYLNVVGAGAEGFFEVSPQMIDFETVKVGNDLIKEAILINKGKVNLCVQAQLCSKTDDPQTATLMKDFFKIDFSSGIINSESKKVIKIYFKPKVRFSFDLYLKCILKSSTNSPSSKDPIFEQSSSLECNITIKANGDFPLMRIMDIRNEQISMPNLWKSFELSVLNQELLSPLNEKELHYNNSDTTTMTTSTLNKFLKIVTWDFGKITVKSGNKPAPRKVIITLKNVGGVSSDFIFSMPNDTALEMEPWADPGEPTEEQAFEDHVIKENLFEISPKKGLLKPNDQIDVELLYYPKEIGKFYLNVIFKIINGKPIIVKLMGETLAKRGHLWLKNQLYEFNPTPISLLNPIVYPVEIQNIGPVKIKYEIDQAPLKKYIIDNYNFKVFAIQNPEGVLMANETQYLYFHFYPIEAKLYSLKLPICVSDIEGVVQNLELNIKGSGIINSPKSNEVLSPNIDGIPSLRSYLDGKGSKASFSLDKIDFGVMEIGKPSRRIVILYNHSKKESLIFEFMKTGLIFEDELVLEPISGELKPETFITIKMTLNSSSKLSSYDGEIECKIEWINSENSQKNNEGEKNNIESLFLGIAKKPLFKLLSESCHKRDESFLENILIDMIKSCLDDPLIEQTMSRIDNLPIYTTEVTDNDPIPEEKEVKNEFEIRRDELINKEKEEVNLLNSCPFEELDRKIMFLNDDIVSMVEGIVDNTLFNIMEEATHNDYNLLKPPKTYITKQQTTS